MPRRLTVSLTKVVGCHGELEAVLSERLVGNIHDSSVVDEDVKSRFACNEHVYVVKQLGLKRGARFCGCVRVTLCMYVCTYTCIRVCMCMCLCNGTIKHQKHVSRLLSSLANLRTDFMRDRSSSSTGRRSNGTPVLSEMRSAAWSPFSTERHAM